MGFGLSLGLRRARPSRAASSRVPVVRGLLIGLPLSLGLWVVIALALHAAL